MQEHQSLLNDYLAALEETKKYSPAVREQRGSDALNLPFHPSSYYPPPLSPKPDHEIAFAWRDRLAVAMGRLREYFDFFVGHSEVELNWYPLARWGRGPGSTMPNAFYDLDSGQIARALDEHLKRLQELSRESAVQSLPTEAPHKSVEAIHRDWVKDRWCEKLRAARLNRGEAQKQAAQKCGGAALETYRKWEQGRRPDQRSINAILTYCTTANQETSV